MNQVMEWLKLPVATPNALVRRDAETRQKVLTKPPGALGQLETLAVRLAALQGVARPRVDKVAITVFVGDHGVVAEGVSAFPQAVTVEMVRNFARGGAAITVLARELNATLEVINLGTVTALEPLAGVMDCRLGPGTANFTLAPALSEDQLEAALRAGRHAAERAKSAGAEIFIGGEMGIGNTTAATTLCCQLLAIAPEQLTGPGTGLNAEGVAHKVRVIKRALDFHNQYRTAPLETLRRVGGFEIAALVGAYIACAQLGLPVLVDGFIASSAALIASKLQTEVNEWLLFAHASAEPGHRLVLAALAAQPLLDIGMRLGEGSGAAVTVPLLRMACALHNGMATFAEANVSEKC